MVTADGTLLLAQVDSARAVSTMYTLSLLTTLPLGAAAIALFTVRHAAARARIVVWRAMVVALLLTLLGRIPAHALAWVVPSALSLPLVALGRVQVTAESLQSLAGSADLGSLWRSVVIVRALFAVYLLGVAFVLIPTIAASFTVRRRVRRRCATFHCPSALDEARRVLGVRRNVQVWISPAVRVPLTWGLVQPVVVLPRLARHWSRAQLEIVLRHELAHVRAGDWTFAMAGRLMCAVYWFHPAAWWVARGLRRDCELACDERVIASGVRRSDYAELLVGVADAIGARPAVPDVAMALSQRSGLAKRLDALLDDAARRQPARSLWSAAAALLIVATALSVSAVRVAPSRQVLTRLMGDSRWESRAYAVMGLAQRRDSVAVARTAAELDPNPRVRAWARYALGGPPPTVSSPAVGVINRLD